MQKVVRLGIIGCGVIGHHHAASIERCPIAQLVAVTDALPEAAEQVAAEHDVKRVAPDAAALIADDEIDAVILALHAAVRSPLAIAALEAGKHVLLEKPVARNLEECRLIRAAQGDRVVGVCSARYSTLKSAAAARQVVADGTLGKIRVVRCRGLESADQVPSHPPPPWRLSHRLNGGGILANWGSYDLDYLLSIAGWQLRPRYALAHTWPCAPHLSQRVAPDSDAEAHVAGSILCDGGTVIQIERGEFLPLAQDMAWEITGETGSLRLRMYQGLTTPTVALDQADAQSGWITTAIFPEPDDENTTDLVVKDFAEALAEGRPPQTTLEQAMVIQQIIDAVYESSRTGRPVEIGNRTGQLDNGVASYPMRCSGV